MGIGCQAQEWIVLLSTIMVMFPITIGILVAGVARILVAVGILSSMPMDPKSTALLLHGASRNLASSNDCND